MNRIFLTVLLIFSPSFLSANQTFIIKDNGSISFNVSTTDITRVSIKGDRIPEVINSDSNFQIKITDDGDLFFRPKKGSSFKIETGHIKTEKGNDISFTMKPVSSFVKPVLVTVEGGEKNNSQSSNFSLSDDVSDNFTNIFKGIYNEHLLNKKIKGRNNSLYKSIKGSGWTAKVYIASSGKYSRSVKEVEFYRKGVSAIWIVNPNLAPRKKTFVIVVRGAL